MILILVEAAARLLPQPARVHHLHQQRERRGPLFGGPLALPDFALQVACDRRSRLLQVLALEVREQHGVPGRRRHVAMPLRIWPAPTTPTVRISMTGLYCRDEPESNRRKDRAVKRQT